MCVVIHCTVVRGGARADVQAVVLYNHHVKVKVVNIVYELRLYILLCRTTSKEVRLYIYIDIYIVLYNCWLSERLYILCLQIY